MPSPTHQDDELLARLNALKKSSVSFDNSPSPSTAPSNATPKPDAPDDLAARFARLGSASPSSSPKPSWTTSSSDTQRAKAPIIAPGAPSYLEGIAEGVGGCDPETNFEDEKSLEELVGELGPREEWDISTKDEKDVRKLLKDVKTILPEVQKSMREERAQERRPADAKGEKTEEELTDWENVEVDIGNGGFKVGREAQHEDAEGGDREEEGENKKSENEEADDVIARVMAELEISRKYDPPSPPAEDDKASDDGGDHQAAEGEKKDLGESNAQRDNDLSLPSAPTSIPEDDFARTQALEDALTARLAALSKPHSASNALGLPSAPSFSPANKPPKIQSSLSKAIDDEIDTWCIICNDDATLKCLGCDGDLYCHNCWMEGHRGESAGFEERRHKAVVYSKDKDKRKKQAAA